jgi:hypothetical protein
MKGEKTLIRKIFLALALLFAIYIIIASFQGGLTAYTEKLFGCRRMNYENIK